MDQKRVCGLLLFALLPSTPPAQTVSYSGIARDGSGAELYREEHLLTVTEAGDERRIVLYRCPSGEAFARKTLSRDAGSFIPAFELQDRRADYREGIEDLDDGVRLFAGPAAVPTQTVVAATGANPVADAGFDAFVQVHRDALERGETIALQFLIPAEGRSRALTIAKVDEADILDRPASLYRLKLGAWYAFLAPHIDGWYDRQTGQLLRYEGLSNIRDGGGRNLQVRIDFPPDERSAASWPDADDRIFDEPLVAGCSP